MTHLRKPASVMGDLEHARHLLGRVEFFFGMVETVEGEDRADHALALAEVGNRTLRKALSLFDGALRAVGARWRRERE